MASNPVKRDVVALLASMAPDPDPLLTDDEQALAYLCAYMANGGRLSKLAKELDCSRWLLDRWIKGDTERHQQFLRARVGGADALVDEGGDLLDSATRDTIAVANARAGWRKWLASKYDPATYGEGTPSQVSIGSLHLHAALSRPTLPVQLSAPPTVKLLDTPPALGPIPGGVERGYPTEAEPHPTESKALGTGEIVVEAPLLDSGDKG